jgi:uncharacterized membrane protein
VYRSTGANVTVFFATVTHLTAASLVTSGLLQLVFTRFIADRLFEKKPDIVVPNLLGALLVTTAISGGLGMLFVTFAFKGMYLYRLLFILNFVVLNNVWILSVFLTSLKSYRSVVILFLAGYGTAFILALLLAPKGAEGLLLSFFIGQAILFAATLWLVVREYPTSFRVEFQFLDRRKVFPVLAGTGALYNVGIWIDKVIFWWAPETGIEVVGPIHMSPIYDVPIFLAYFTIIPGMAVFLVRIETDFADAYDSFYRSIREGAALVTIQRGGDRMVKAARDGIYDIFRVQGITVVLFILIAPRILRALHIPLSYTPLLTVDVIATGIQVVFLAILTVLFYLDYRELSFTLNVLFCLANLILTLVSIQLGPRFYGYGFALSLLIVSTAGIAILTRRLKRLEYETFMR